MKQFLAALLIAVSGLAGAQQATGTQTSPNLVYTNLNPYPGTGAWPGTWSGFINTESGGGGLSGGNVPAYNATSGQFMFGYQQGTVAYNYALSTALKNSGTTWLGYNYSWEYFNQDFSRGTLSANVTFNSISGTVLHSRNWNLGQTTQGWTAVNGTETFTNPLGTANINSFNVSFTGRDDRFWAGYYGPQVRNPSISVLYTFDQCYSNPLSSPDCPGYAQAYHDQQCAANPLYATTCPGYAAALLTQQCAANPLSNTQCPGYAQAYFDYQCQLNGLYDKSCPNYTTAYATKQLLSSSTTATNTAPTSVEETSTQLNLGVANPAASSAATSTQSTTSQTSPTSVIGPVSVIAPPPPPPAVSTAISAVSVAPPPSPAQQQERQQDQKKTEGAVATVERRAGGDRREAGRQVAAAAKDAAEKAKNAASLEAQAAGQGLVVGLMGYVPGFSAYQNAIVPDALAQQVARQYFKPTVDNRSAQRQLSGTNDRLHREMVEQQYNSK